MTLLVAMWAFGLSVTFAALHIGAIARERLRRKLGTGGEA